MVHSRQIRDLIRCIPLLAAILSHAADRHRPVIVGSRLLSDKGSVLRGVRYGLDFNEPLPSRSRILELSSFYGLNALHVYLEKYDTPVGQNASKADSLVSWTSQAGMYLVITIGCGTHNGHFDRRQAMGFWKFYAPRYKDRTHVIYELHNEPEPNCDAPYSDTTIRFEADLYDLVHSRAPKTMVLMLGYINVPHASVALKDISRLRKVDWKNAAIGFHGYYSCCTKLQEADSIAVLAKAGYAVVNTEFADKRDWTSDAKLYERMGIGWFNFQYLLSPPATMTKFKFDVNQSGLSWKPDFGDWPR